MSNELAFTPARRIIAIASSSGQGMLLDVGASSDADRRITKVARAFTASQAEGLFTLATEKFDTSLAPSLVYWRWFAGRYLTELCHAADPSRVATPAPESSELDAVVDSAPPMPGAEYLTAEALAEIWSDLDTWVRAKREAYFRSPKRSRFAATVLIRPACVSTLPR